MLKAEEIKALIAEKLGAAEKKADVSEIGYIISVGDGIARLHGLDKCMASELLEFPGGVRGLAMNLTRGSSSW